MGVEDAGESSNQRSRKEGATLPRWMQDETTFSVLCENVTC